MATIQSLGISLFARTGRFERGMRKARREVRDFSRSVRSTSRMITGLAVPLATFAAGAGFAVLTKQSFSAIDATAKVSDKLGVATERLTGLRFAAEQFSGFASGQFDTALQRMVRRISEAAQGSGEAKGALRELGLDARQLARLTPDQQFARLADRFASVSEQGARVRLAMRLFDTEGVGLVTTLQKGSAALEDMQKMAERLGVAFSRVDAAKVEAANDALGRMRARFRGAFNELAINLAPTVEALADRITRLGTDGESTGEMVVRAVRAMTLGVAKLADFFEALRGAWHLFEAGVQGGALAIVAALAGIGRAAEELAEFFGKEVDFTSALDEQVRAFGDAALESAAKAEAAFARFSDGENSRKVRAFFDDLEVRAEKAAAAVAKTTPGGRAADGLAGEFKLSSGKVTGATVIDLRRTFVGGPSAASRQEVHDPQLATVIDVLQAISRQRGGPALTA